VIRWTGRPVGWLGRLVGWLAGWVKEIWFRLLLLLLLLLLLQLTTSIWAQGCFDVFVHVCRYAPECNSRLVTGPQGCENECKEGTKNAPSYQLTTGNFVFLQKCALETPSFYGNHNVKLHISAPPSGAQLPRTHTFGRSYQWCFDVCVHVGRYAQECKSRLVTGLQGCASVRLELSLTHLWAQLPVVF
jgi:hypothetical protein